MAICIPTSTNMKVQIPTLAGSLGMTLFWLVRERLAQSNAKSPGSVIARPPTAVVAIRISTSTSPKVQIPTLAGSLGMTLFGFVRDRIARNDGEKAKIASL